MPRNIGRSLGLSVCVFVVNVTLGCAQEVPSAPAPPPTGNTQGSMTANAIQQGLQRPGFTYQPSVEPAPQGSLYGYQGRTHKAGHEALWKWSLAALAGANALDIASSWRKYELNPALAAPSSTFGAKSAAIKVGILGAVVVVQWLAVSRHPSHRLYRALSILNFCDSGVVAGTAGHNFTVSASPQ